MRIGFDLDDVIKNTFPFLLAFCNEEYDENLCKEDFTSSHFEEIWKISHEEKLARLNAFDKTNPWKQIPLIPGAEEAILTLANLNQLHVITARPEEIAKPTQEGIEERLPGKFLSITHCSKNFGANYHRPKQMVCKEKEIDLFFDDHPVIVEACVQAGIRAYLFDQPWNRNSQLPRVNSWTDIINMVR